jgi:hypothetical protein
MIVDNPGKLREQLRLCPTRADRLPLLPLLSPIQLDQLKQCCRPIGDGYVISKSVRDTLAKSDLIYRFNGWNIISDLGLIVLDTLGLVKGVKK